MPTPVFDVDLRAVLDGMDSRRRRSRQRGPGASDLGTCRRRVAYKLAGQPIDNPASKSKAIQGTMLHKTVLPALRTAHGGLIEVKLARRGVLTGSCDWLRYDPLGLPIVGDVKTTSATQHDTTVRGDLTRPHLWQFHAYADMLRRGEIADTERRLPHGVPVEVVEVEVLWLCRDDGRADSRRTPFQQDVADEAWAWLAEVRDRLETDGLKMVPRDLPGPYDSAICRGCPFARDCWKWEPDQDRRAPVELAEPELEEWARKYRQAQQTEAAATAEKKLARAHLDGHPPTTWPSGWILKWNGGAPKWETEPDVDMLVQEFQEAGLPVPVRRVNKARAPSISVLPPKAHR